MISENLTALQSQFDSEIQKAQTEEDVLRLKSAYLGKKGFITGLLKEMAQLPLEERPIVGARTNAVKEKIEEECRTALERLTAEKRRRQIQSESLDITLPGRQTEKGHAHPLSQVLVQAEDIFRRIGFDIFEGPEIESDFYNFEALNIPADHPARDMQDTFYIDVGAGFSRPEMKTGEGAKTAPLLRTHTSPVQIHVMEKAKPPIRMIAPGVVYRRDFDISHSPMFHQIEGLVVDEGIQFADLKGIVTYFLEEFFQGSLAVRFRPSFFPFTEPSAEVDIECVACHKNKKDSSEFCRLCRGSRWLEVMGCGMVHPAVFEKVHYDSQRWKGFAFGMGIERLAMLKYRIPDIRLFFENDLRFLKQFS